MPEVGVDGQLEGKGIVGKKAQDRCMEILSPKYHPHIQVGKSAEERRKND